MPGGSTWLSISQVRAFNASTRKQVKVHQVHTLSTAELHRIHSVSLEIPRVVFFLSLQHFKLIVIKNKKNKNLLK